MPASLEIEAILNAMSDQKAKEEGHLPYYERERISPVRYRMESLQAHFDRRDSLYRSLGLSPLGFRGSRVLEVAAGSGQNSLYVASCHPASYDLIEPNLVGVRDIRDSYESFQKPHTAPTLHDVQFENFSTQSEYDVVICENWLGSSPQDLKSIGRLASLVTPGGILVVTCVPLSGFFPNIMRKLMAVRLTGRDLTFQEQTAQLVEIFGPHLSTLGDMTRSHRDWVQDCMLNPHYLRVALPIETVIEAAGAGLEILQTYPRFAAEWRWFKSLVGDKRQFNERMLGAYRENLQNFIDYRNVWPVRDASANARLDDRFREIYRVAIERSVDDGDDFIRTIGENLSACMQELTLISPQLAAAVAELKSVWEHPGFDAVMVRDMKIFNSLFGRETVYLSFTRLRVD